MLPSQLRTAGGAVVRHASSHSSAQPLVRSATLVDGAIVAVVDDGSGIRLAALSVDQGLQASSSINVKLPENFAFLAVCASADDVFLGGYVGSVVEGETFDARPSAEVLAELQTVPEHMSEHVETVTIGYWRAEPAIVTLSKSYELRRIDGGAAMEDASAWVTAVDIAPDGGVHALIESGAPGLEEHFGSRLGVSSPSASGGRQVAVLAEALGESGPSGMTQANGKPAVAWTVDGQGLARLFVSAQGGWEDRSASLPPGQVVHAEVTEEGIALLHRGLDGLVTLYLSDASSWKSPDGAATLGAAGVVPINGTTDALLIADGSAQVMSLTSVLSTGAEAKV